MSDSGLYVSGRDISELELSWRSQLSVPTAKQIKGKASIAEGRSETPALFC